MKELGRRDYLLIGLALFAALQLAVLAAGGIPGPHPPASWLQVGDTLSMIRAVDARGTQVPLKNGEPTVLLVFRSDCGHCQVVAPLWQDWIGEFGQTLRVVALTSEPIETASDFVIQHGLDVPVATVDGRSRRGEAHLLLARTPWVFLLDGEGVILAQGHGSQIDRLGADQGLEARQTEDR